MKPATKWMLGANLAVATVLTFVVAHLMVSPGKLIEGHTETETDCFACHDAFLGSSTAKCVECHKIADIGRITTKGVAVVSTKLNPFHKALTEPGCTSCHTDHAGMALYREKPPFPHDGVEPAKREDCVSCHRRPDDPLHRAVSDKCADCHKVEKWKPAKFDHDVLAPKVLADCYSCHKAKVPDDPLHRGATKKCGICHTVDTWERKCPGFCGYKLKKDDASKEVQQDGGDD